MKIYEWNIGMSATIPSNNGYNLLSWVIDEILDEEPDCVVLTEFVIAKGFDYYISKLEERGYQWFVSTTTKFNGILIALKSKTFNFDETFDYNKPTVKTGDDVLIGDDLPNLYEIQVTWNGRPLSIIGVRIKVDINNVNMDYKKNQFKALDDYLSKQTYDVLCIGDYNAHWGNLWSTPRNTILNKSMEKGYNLYNPTCEEEDWYSFVQNNGIKSQLDHLITNISDRSITVNYDWNFINQSRYSNVTKESADKPNGKPAHAIIKATII